MQQNRAIEIIWKALPTLALLAAVSALTPAGAAAPSGGEVQVLGIGGATDSIPPYIDAIDGIATRGQPWDPDPLNWGKTANVAVRGAQYGESVAMVKLRIEGKGDPVKISSPQQTMLVYDNSGSMSVNDPTGLRCPAMQYYVDQLTVPSEIGTVAFESTAQLRHPLSQNYANVKSSITCSDLGATNQHDGMMLANNELIPKKQQGFVWAIVLLSDGQWNSGGDPQPEVDRDVVEGVRVYTICLSSGCNSVEMQQWAQQTKGKFYQVSSAGQLKDVFDDISNSIVNDDAGKPPKSGLPMVRLKMRPGIEVVPGTFRCESANCVIPLPTNTGDPVPGNEALALQWDAPVSVLKIGQHWQISFGVRSYDIGQQIRVNDIAMSYVEYDRYDGSPGGADAFEQLYLEVGADVPPCACGPVIGEPPAPPPPPPTGGIPQLIPNPQSVPVTYIQNLPVLHGVTVAQGIPLQYLLGSAMGLAVADRVKVKSRIRQGVKVAMAAM